MTGLTGVMADREKENQWREQCRALIKRNYLIKRRNWRGTMWEFLLPMIFVVVFGAIKLGSNQPTPPTSNYDVKSIEGTGAPFYKMLFQQELIVAPNSTIVREVAEKVCVQLNCSGTRMFSDVEGAESYYMSRQASVMGLMFDLNMTSYSIRYPKGANLPNYIISTKPGDCSGYDCPAARYLTSGVVALQSAVDTELIRIFNSSFRQPAIDAQLMPELRDVSSSDQTLRYMFPIYFIYAMSFLLTYLAGAAVDDKAKNRQDHLTMMGLSRSAYWASWAVVHLPQLAFIAVFAVGALAAFGFFKTFEAYLFFFVAVVIYSMTSILMGICWAAVIHKTEFIFFALLGTTAIGAIGFVNMKLTDYTTDPTDPNTSPSIVAGIICLLPPSCMLTLLERMYTLDAKLPDGLVSGAFTAGNLPLVALLAILVLDVFLWAIIALWLDGVLPTPLGARQPLCFCFDKKYWRPEPIDPGLAKATERLAKTNYQSTDTNTNCDVEPPSRSLHGKEAVRLFGMEKTFVQSTGMFSQEYIPAVKGVSLDIYEGQITALLGHNGAGKTTLINMLTGIIPVSAGSATLYGYNITNPVDLQSIRNLIGICPQHDVLVPKLTVREHLEFFARLKGVPENLVDEKVETTLTDCDLKDQKDVDAEKLSGGQKRKLNVGMALIGDPKILFLDEPTAGMDPYSRRHLWSLLKKSRAGRVILLTTHFMDEADILADRKAVISKGRLQCAGSSLYMKNKFGIGYQLTLLVDDLRLQDELTTLIGEIIEDAAHRRTYGKEITYNLPIAQSTKFSDLFKALDTNKDRMTVESYSISMTTLEEVFLKLGEQAEEEERLAKEKEAGKTNGGDSVTVNLTVERDEPIDPIDLTRDPNVNTARLRLICMFKQRMRMVPREIFLLVSTVIFLIFMAVGLVMMITSDDGISKAAPPYKTQLALNSSLTQEGYNAHTLLYRNKGSYSIADFLSSLRVVKLPDMALQSYDGSYSKAMPASPFGYDIVEISSSPSWYNLTIRYNHSYLQSLPVALNTLSRVLLLGVTEGKQDQVQTSLWEWPDFQSRTVTFTAGSFAGLSLLFAIYMGTSPFTLLIVGEREKELRSLLRTAGVTVKSYFTVYIMLFFVTRGPILLASFIAIMAAQIPAYNSIGAGVLLFVHLVIQLFLTMMLAFCWSYAFDKVQTAGNVISVNIWVSMLFYTPLTILVNIPSTQLIAKILHHTFCFLVPYYSFPGGLLMIEQTYRTYVIENNPSNIDSIPSKVYFYPENGVISAILGGILWTFLLTFFVRVGEIRKYGGKMSDLFKCFTNSLSNYDPSAKNSDLIPDEEEDVVEERREVDRLWQQRTNRPKEVVMLAHSLRKEFPDKKKKTKVAVRNVTFHVPNGQVFGLLGPNGAGKTTVLNMIIAEHAPTAGQVMVDNVEVHSALSDAFEIIGYCPQRDALWPKATTTELMVFFGISSGLSEAQAKKVADYYIKMLKIEEHKDKYSENLSGGTKRKVSFALSLMGWPRLVLLDEPSTGLDPSSKRFLWDTIRSSFNGHDRAAILTTHYMEEAEALCSRIGIMVNGAVECLGTPQHLKDKYGDGYQLEIKLMDMGDDSSEHMAKLKRFMNETFPNSTVIEEFSDRIQYSMATDSISTPAQVFGPIEENKEGLHIEEYSFSQSTLEQVFLTFAKAQLEADEDEENAKKSRERGKQLLRQKSVHSASENLAYTHL